MEKDALDINYIKEEQEEKDRKTKGGAIKRMKLCGGREATKLQRRAAWWDGASHSGTTINVKAFF